MVAGSQEYGKYVNYIDRDEAKSNQSFQAFDTYMEYMGDEAKQGELFSSEIDSLSIKEKQKLKDAFQLAQTNESPMWQDVISFDNKWLEEQQMYDSQTNVLNEVKTKSIIRAAVTELLRAENMEHTAVWLGSIHHNTDNIHVHIATVEPIPTRRKVSYFDEEENEWKEQYRAKRRQGSLEKMKSRVINGIYDRSNEYNKIDGLIRGTIKNKKEKDIQLSNQRKTKRLFIKAIEQLPDDLRQWKYGYESVNKARPYIDQITDAYLEMYHKDEMKELNKLLDEQVDVSKRLYGDNSKHEQYKQTKLDDLKKRMGNAVLTEMREYVKKERKQSFRNKNKQVHRHKLRNWQHNNSIHFSLLRLNAGMRKKFHEYQKDRNLAEFDRMMDGYER